MVTKSKISKVFSALFAFACIFIIANNKASAAEALTQGQKEALHEQYVEILNEVKSTVVWGNSLVGIEVAPISEFKEDEWVSPETFKQRAVDATQANAVDINSGITPYSSSSASHNKNINHGSSSVSMTIQATFTTQLSSGRQVFTNYSGLSVTASSGTWKTTGVDARIIDGGRTYTFTIGGQLTYVGLVSSHTINTDFLCSSSGVVS
ncbi:hypothetical protein ACQKM9_17810 [Viridibacillus sp. NPDC093762]|uniref:hypothetical protein n=1 Tax=Viridibacillus sp. NPDC093762 TaxID=3390720 RepID=UPI003D07C430